MENPFHSLSHDSCGFFFQEKGDIGAGMGEEKYRGNFFFIFGQSHTSDMHVTTFYRFLEKAIRQVVHICIIFNDFLPIFAVMFNMLNCFGIRTSALLHKMCNLRTFVMDAQ